jgi:hypothetical protein
MRLTVKPCPARVVMVDSRPPGLLPMSQGMISKLGGAAVGGLSAQIPRFARWAARIAQNGAGGDYVGEAVEQMDVTHAVKANIKVIRAADEMVGTLFDIVA